MSRLWNALCSIFTTCIEISEGAKNIEQIFHDQGTQQPFFHLVRVTFEQYDEWNNTHNNNSFSEDIDFIIECTMATFSSSDHMELFPQRVDAYFYILCRIREYIHMKHGSIHRVDELRKMLLGQLGVTLKSSRGSYPSLYAIDRDVINRMDFRKHLTPRTNINNVQDLLIFFALCKLAFQSSFVLDEHGCLQWIEILSRVREWKISLQDFVQHYVEFIDAFEVFPLDVRAFICLVQRIPLTVQMQSSPFEVYRAMLSQLKLDEREFFHRYQFVFETGSRNKLCSFLHVSSLLIMLHQYDDLFGSYLQKWAYSVSSKELWSMFLFLSKTQVFAGNTEDHLISTLTMRTENASFEMWKHYCQLVTTCCKQFNDENRIKCLRIFEAVFSECLGKQMHDKQYTSQLNEDLLSELLTSAIELSVSPSLQKPSCSLLMRYLLFEMDSHIRNKFDKLERLFGRVNQFKQYFNQLNDPINIIQDEWLSNDLYRIPEDWLDLGNSKYRSLCELHHDNPWSLYIWSRLLHLSFSRVNTTDTNEVLLELEKWMIKVEHKNYDKNDPLTTILVGKLFELILYRHLRSVLNLPNIPTIMQYIICAHVGESMFVDCKKVDEFIQAIEQSIQSVLHLKGKLSCLNICSISDECTKRHFSLY